MLGLARKTLNPYQRSLEFVCDGQKRSRGRFNCAKYKDSGAALEVANKGK
jgi:hypothetical protein